MADCQYSIRNAAAPPTYAARSSPSSGAAFVLPWMPPVQGTLFAQRASAVAAYTPRPAAAGTGVVCGGAFVPPSPSPDLNAVPTDILLSNNTVDEFAPGAIIGTLTVVDADLPDDDHSFVLTDSRFEVTAAKILKLKAGVQLVAATEPTVLLTITATDLAGAQVSRAFTIAVIAASAPWILAGGAWNDAGVWRDPDVWTD